MWRLHRARMAAPAWWRQQRLLTALRCRHFVRSVVCVVVVHHGVVRAHAVPGGHLSGTLLR